ncbi:MAG: hypothetical protein ACKVOK_05515 [Flavobacteriales bacterium]
MSNQFFSFSRFAKYFRFQLNLLGRGYALAYAAALIISLIVAIILVAVELSGRYPRKFPDEFQAIVLFGLGVISVLIGTWMFARLNRREAMIGFLTIPTSQFEKTVLAFLFSFVVPTAVCAFFYLICEQVMFAYFKSHAIPFLETDYSLYNEKAEMRYYGIALWTQIVEMPYSKLFILLIGGIYSTIHSFYILGSLFYRRFSFVLTSISVGLLIFGNVALAILLSFGILKEERMRYFDEYAVHLSQKWFGSSLYLEDEMPLLYVLTFAIILAVVVLWSAIYLKLKEKEVR